MKIEIPVDARLTSHYINEESLRMDIYQRLGDAVTLEEVDTIWREVQDRFGRLPLEAQWLRCFSRLKVHAGAKGFTSLKWENQVLTAERKDKSSPVTRKYLLKFNKNPQEFEKLVFALIN